MRTWWSSLLRKLTGLDGTSFVPRARGFTGSDNEVAETGLLARLEHRHDNSNAKPFFSNDGFDAAGVPYHTYSGQDIVTAAAIYAF